MSDVFTALTRATVRNARRMVEDTREAQLEQLAELVVLQRKEADALRRRNRALAERHR